MPNIFIFTRGSTCGYEYEDKIYFIIHKTTIINNYYHMLVIFDLSMNLIAYIDEFKFENCKIEFSIGLVIEKEKIIISYSTYDNNSKIAIYDKKYIESLLIYI